MKLIIADGRDFNDYELIRNEPDKFNSELDPDLVTMVSSGAKGLTL